MSSRDLGKPRRTGSGFSLREPRNDVASGDFYPKISLAFGTITAKRSPSAAKLACCSAARVARPVTRLTAEGPELPTPGVRPEVAVST